MKNPSIDQIFGTLFKKPETDIEKVIRLAKELSEKIDLQNKKV